MRHFRVRNVTCAEMSNGHFGTSAEMSWVRGVSTPNRMGKVWGTRKGQIRKENGWENERVDGGMGKGKLSLPPAPRSAGVYAAAYAVFMSELRMIVTTEACFVT